MPMHIVEYDIWCSKCKHDSKLESEDPCNDCLNEPFNEDSRCPTKFEEDKSQE